MLKHSHFTSVAGWVSVMLNTYILKPFTELRLVPYNTQKEYFAAFVFYLVMATEPAPKVRTATETRLWNSSDIGV